MSDMINRTTGLFIICWILFMTGNLGAVIRVFGVIMAEFIIFLVGALRYINYELS